MQSRPPLPPIPADRARRARDCGISRPRATPRAVTAEAGVAERRRRRRSGRGRRGWRRERGSAGGSSAGTGAGHGGGEGEGPSGPSASGPGAAASPGVSSASSSGSAAGSASSVGSAGRGGPGPALFFTGGAASGIARSPQSGRRDLQFEQGLARDAVSRGQIQPLDSILGTVQAAVPGSVLSARLKKDDEGVWIYRMVILTPDGRYRNVVVDAARSVIIQIK